MPKGNYKKKVPAKAKAKALVSKEPLNPVQKEQVKKMTKIFREVKYHTNQGVVLFGGTFPAGGLSNTLINDLTDLPQNVTDTGRTGDEIELTGIHVKFWLEQNAVAGVNNINRVMIFQYKPNIPLVLAVDADVYKILGPGPSTGLVRNAMSFNHYDGRSDVIVLYDQSFAMTDTDTRSTVYKSFFLNIKKANKRIKFENAGTTGANHIYILAISMDMSNNQGLTYNARTYYRDS